MESKPVSFCGLKAILTYMEPSFRFNLALKISSLRKAEKSAPLIIKRLELRDNCLVINTTEYSMRVYRQCQADPGLLNGEVDGDSDEFGFKISIDESLQPGDLKLTHDGSERRHIYGFRYDCPDKMGLLPCDHRIRLYVSGSMSQFPYTNMKMYHLMRRLLTIFFGNRNGEWTINKMSIKDKVLRWPLDGRKPIVRKIKIGHWSSYQMDAFQSIIDTSVPLTSLKTTGRISNHPFLKNVEHLIIYNDMKIIFQGDLLSIQVPNVTIKTPSAAIDHYLQSLVFKFMERTRHIGVRFSICASSKINLKRINHPAMLEKSKSCVKLAMGNAAVVVVRYRRTHSRTWLTIETVPKKK
ncbi:hypothetical protein B9Z55_000188 [Caenorhabditis nigoni]|uniref:DUF38 domain-containing protein n=1 Tax=Caenorhabditis nigoni TaxID=1611254 RepID=A0A2G5VHS8_9PELO|nr:hypothetical protein B9Z55_000188 [Caenorhabditis nigoni]